MGKLEMLDIHIPLRDGSRLVDRTNHIGSTMIKGLLAETHVALGSVFLVYKY